MAFTVKLPFVSVPVLSNTTVSTPASVSRSFAPLIRIPLRDAPPIPPKNDSGTETTRAQGQETIRNIRARFIHSLHSPLKSRGGTSASRTAAATTQGVYHLAKRVIKFSALAFFSEAFSTSSSIFATVLSA